MSRTRLSPAERIRLRRRLRQRHLWEVAGTIWIAGAFVLTVNAMVWSWIVAPKVDRMEEFGALYTRFGFEIDRRLTETMTQVRHDSQQVVEALTRLDASLRQVQTSLVTRHD